MLYPFNYENKCRIYGLFSHFGYGFHFFQFILLNDDFSFLFTLTFSAVQLESNSDLSHFAFIGYNHGFRFFKFHGFNHGCFLEVTLFDSSPKNSSINKSIIQKLSVQVKYFTLSVNSSTTLPGNSPVPATTRCP